MGGGCRDLSKSTHSQSIQQLTDTVTGVAGDSRSREIQTAARKSVALKFVVMVGALSFFADFTYEGSRSTLGPYLALLQASATTVGIVAGFGELLGYALRLVSGRAAEGFRVTALAYQSYTAWFRGESQSARAYVVKVY
jgi:hypothetical protein